MNPDTGFTGKNILLVEDDPAVRDSIKLLLGLDRHAVTEAANGREALQLFASSRYDLVLTDYLMPEMPGDELARNLKHLAPAQPVLIVTAYADEVRSRNQAADAVLEKPFRLEDLRRAMTFGCQPGIATSGLPAPCSALRQRAEANTEVLRRILECKPPAGS